MKRLTLLVPVMMLLLGSGCRTTRPEEVATPSQTYTVELSCAKTLKQGKRDVTQHNVVIMPGDKVVWAIRRLDGTCRVWGAIVPPERSKPDKCDIRLRSKAELAPVGQPCRCVPGVYELTEGRPTSEDCCRKFPGSIYCKDGQVPPPEEEMEEVIQETDSENEVDPDALEEPETAPYDSALPDEEEDEIEDN